VPFASTEVNLQIFEELVGLFRSRAPRPSKGWPDFDDLLDDRLFPSSILTEERLAEALRPSRLRHIREALTNSSNRANNLRQSTALLGDPTRCVHIGDRESDIYELFCTAKDVGTHFLLRTCVDRLAGDGAHTIAAVMEEVSCKGLHWAEVLDRKGNPTEAILELKYRRVRVLPPIGKQSRHPSLELTVLHATERGKPKGRDPIVWKLITYLPITSRDSSTSWRRSASWAGASSG
jgi:hypothetical protein